MADPPPSAALTLVLGGARSGKSSLAERITLAGAGDGPAHYVATAHVEPGDEDFARRVEVHRQRRVGRFRTVEAGDDLPGVLRALPPGPALVDSLGSWLASPAAIPTWSDEAGAAPGDDPDGPFALLVDDLVAALAARPDPTVVVSDEAGLGVHPEHPVGRRWRDALGVVNVRVAAAAGHAWLVVAGRVVPLARPADVGLPAAPETRGAGPAGAGRSGGVRPLR